MFDRPLDCIYQAANWQYWVPDVGFKRCMPTHIWGVLTGWHSIWLFAASPALQEELYAARLEWWEPVECCRILSVPTPLILANYSNVVIGDQAGTNVVWRVAALEFVILALMGLILVTQRGSVW